ncbi:hypothetical protein GTY75_05995 [Streptomyces sp. SID8381]|uniref:hypothetical protein n=1 Tax=unclassified Streptomyces TaxID=2593676 RepID=UPI00131A3909|nr:MULTISPECIES: hypothetical protein [unclassified Streptomyces]MYS41982.1 hypothetical protein [Streptomyces sp. SID5998]MYX26225.1 hypothetical protein [Streptomyces sp. SID8381]NED35335.1 hypothetical protein [Streptomyces sp. SID8499]
MRIRMSQVAATALLALGAVLLGHHAAAPAPAHVLGAPTAPVAGDSQDDLGWQ